KPAIAGQLYLALDCAGLTENRLAEAHAHLLEQCWSSDPSLKRIGLRALELVYRIRGKFHPEAHKREIDAFFEGMRSEEVEHFARPGELPGSYSSPPPRRSIAWDEIELPPDAPVTSSTPPEGPQAPIVSDRPTPSVVQPVGAARIMARSIPPP